MSFENRPLLYTDTCLTPAISILNSPYCLPYIAYNVSSENLVLNQTISPSCFFLYSHHLSAFQCNDTTRRNYLLVTPGSELLQNQALLVRVTKPERSLWTAFA